MMGKEMGNYYHVTLSLRFGVQGHRELVSRLKMGIVRAILWLTA